MQYLLAPIQMLDEFGDSAGIFEVGTLGLTSLGIGRSFIDQADLQALVEERELAQPLGQGVEVVFGHCENRAIGEKMDLCPTLLGRPRLLQLGNRNSLGILLLIGMQVFPDLYVELFAERVHAGNTNPVQSA